MTSEAGASPARWAASVLGFLVLSSWVCLAIGVVVAGRNAWPSKVGMLVTVVFAVLVAGSAPRLPRLPKRHHVVSRRVAPELFRLLNEVGEVLEASPVAVLAFDDSVGSATIRIGLRRRLCVVVGLPLWEALSAKERVALLSHAIARSTNRDVRQSFFVGASLDVLLRWRDTLNPGLFGEAVQTGAPGVSSFSSRLGSWASTLGAWSLMIIPYIIVKYLARLQLFLTLKLHRQSEFEADLTAVTVAGTKAMLALFERMMLAVSIEFAMKRAIARGTDENLWEEIRQRLADLPDSDRRAIRTVAMTEETTPESAHPPTGMRFAAISQAGFQDARVLLDAGWNRRINEELGAARDSIASAIRGW